MRIADCGLRVSLASPTATVDSAFIRREGEGVRTVVASIGAEDVRV